jgi:hypothetical protein
MVERDLIGQFGAQMRDIVELHRAIDDHVDAVAPPAEDQIVEDAAIFGEQQRIAHPPDREALYVGGEQRFQRFIETLAAEEQLAHMADIEQARILAGPEMFGHHAFILDGHVVAGERDHAAAASAVPCVERQGIERFGGFVVVAHIGLHARCNARIR